MTTRHALALLLLSIILVAPAQAQAPGQPTFGSAEEAVQALIAALKAGDDGKLLDLLGPGAEPVVSSGDAVADRAEKSQFLADYAERGELVPADGDAMVLEVGADHWPVPIPVVRKNGRWYWDGAAGAEEIVYRRIGANELGAIDVCRGIVGAQHEYTAEGRDGQPAGAYAQKLISDVGRHNGLYWPVSPGEPPSPAGPLLAKASAENYGITGKPTPYHGYIYRLLYAQGPAAAGGARSYLVDGRLTGGFGLVAFPAEYRESGVMTFLVGKDGVVYERDLGPKTGELAREMKEYNPDSAWERVE